jgi:hypothetical protein
MKKLWKVQVVITHIDEVVFYGEGSPTPQQIEDEGCVTTILENAALDGGGTLSIDTSEITSQSQIPDEWSDIIPYGADRSLDPEEGSCLALLNEGKPY